MTLAEQFKQRGYAIIRNMVDKTETDRLYAYTLKNADLGDKDDGQVPGSPSFYQDREMAKLHAALSSQIQACIQVNLLPVFCYHRVYRKGAILRAHKDSTRAEISATLNLGQQGEPWDIWLIDYNEVATKITLTPGDLLVYHGLKLYHWREKLENSDFVSQTMFHFVDRHGKNTMAVRWEWIRKIRKRCRQMMGIYY